MPRRSSAQLRELVDVEREPPSMDRDDEAQPDADLRRGDRHDGEREDLAGAVAGLPRERDQREVGAVQHDLEREQHDERVPADEDAERAGAEEEAGEREIPGDARPEHQAEASASRRRVCEPRITPPTAAIRSTIDVISNASRWSVRKSLPIQPGEPKVRFT